MTAIKDAMKKAGFDTVTAELRGLIKSAMDKCKGNIERALAEFKRAEKTASMRDEIERFYFVNHLPTMRDQVETDSQKGCVPHDGGGGQSAGETQLNPASLAAVINVRKHVRSRPRSPELRDFESEMKINAVFRSRFVNDRPIGLLAWGELKSLALETAFSAISIIQQKKTEVENAVLMRYLDDTYQVADHSRLVHEVASPSKFRECEKRASEETPRLIERCMKEFAHSVTTPEVLDATPQN